MVPSKAVKLLVPEKFVKAELAEKALYSVLSDQRRAIVSMLWLINLYFLPLQKCTSNDTLSRARIRGSGVLTHIGAAILIIGECR